MTSLYNQVSESQVTNLTTDLAAVTPTYASFNQSSNLALNNPGAGSSTAALIMDIILTGAATSVELPPMNSSPFSVGMAYVIRNPSTGTNAYDLFDNTGANIGVNLKLGQYVVLEILSKATTAGTFGIRVIGTISAQNADNVAITGGSITGLSTLTVTQNSSGATVVGSVSNSSNTANSNALIATAVGGSSSADPYFKATVLGATDWTFGIDNSDNDAFVFSQSNTLGGNNIVRLATTGSVTLPLQPFMGAYLSSAVANVTGDGTVVTVIFDSTKTNRGTIYSTTTGITTVPVAGTYKISGSIGLGGLGTAHTSGIINIVAGSTTYQTTAGNYGAMRDANTNLVLTIPTLEVVLLANDTIKITLQVSNGTKTVGLLGSASPLTFLNVRLLPA